MGIYEHVIWIGGSPCSGKSSIAERLSKEFSLNYYKCDDFLDQYIQRGVQKKKRIMLKFNAMSMEEIWIGRSVHEQTADEIEFYEEAFEMVLEDLAQQNASDLIVVEGAACLPSNMLKYQIDLKKYVCIVPTYDFQIKHYAKREWVKSYLSECSSFDVAFNNWMQRDAQFAKEIFKTATDSQMTCLITHEEVSLEENYQMVKNILIKNGVL